MSFSASLLLGALLGAAYSAAALLVAQKARQLEVNHAIRVVLGGMLIRMVVMLVAFAAILATVAVHRGGLVLGLGIVFLIGLVLEVLFVLPRPRAEA